MPHCRYIALLLLLPTVPMIISDFRRREVNVLWLIILGASTTAISFIDHNPLTIFNNVLINMGLLLFMGACMMAYTKLRYGRSATVFQDYMGWGDVIFMLCTTPLFTLYEYSLFLMVSFLLSLLWWGIWSLYVGEKLTIPLVGTMGVVFSAYVIYCAI